MNYEYKKKRIGHTWILLILVGSHDACEDPLQAGIAGDLLSNEHGHFKKATVGEPRGPVESPSFSRCCQLRIEKLLQWYSL